LRFDDARRRAAVAEPDHRMRARDAAGSPPALISDYDCRSTPEI
jgi:hypothetical protein